MATPPSREEVRTRLAQAIERLEEPQLLLLVRMAEAMTVRIESALAPASDLATRNFAVAFSNFLVLHHATHDELLNKKGFEYAFKYASEAEGKTARINPNPTDAAEDVQVNGVKFSLKTQADANAAKGSVYIQKLMEARWFRASAAGVPRNRFVPVVKRHIHEHLKRYERILVLQAFYGEGKRTAVYRIVEVPKSVLLAIEQLKPDDFTERNEAEGSSADVRIDGEVAFRLRLDGSVEKVRVFNIRPDRCVVHGAWTIPLSNPAAR